MAKENSESKRKPQTADGPKGGPVTPPPASNERGSFRAKSGGDGVREGKALRLSVALTPDGKIDFESTRPATLEKLKTAIRDANAKSKLGMSRGDAAGATIKPQSLGPLFWIAGTFEAWACTTFAQVPGDIAKAVMSYKLGEVAEIAPALATLIQNNGPAWLIRMLNEAEDGPTTRLISTVLKVHLQKYLLLKAALASPAVADSIREDAKKEAERQMERLRQAMTQGPGADKDRVQ